MGFETALSGLNAASSDLDILGNNVANSNTAGFKVSRGEFQDIFATSNLGVASNAIGQGVSLSSVTQIFSQGQFEFTGNSLDLAVNGDGFFRLSDQGTVTYSRAGAFKLNRSGYLVDANDKRLQGYSASNGVVNQSSPVDLQVNIQNAQPNATQDIEIAANLDAGEAIPSSVDMQVATAADGANTGTGAISAATVTNRNLLSGDDYEITFAVPGNTYSIVQDPSGSATAIVTGAAYTAGATITSIPGMTFSISGVPANGDSFTVDTGDDRDVDGFDVTDPTTYSHTTSTTIYDSLGNDHQMTTYFLKTDAADNIWAAFTYIDGELVGPTDGTDDGGYIELDFDDTGALVQWRVRDVNGAAWGADAAGGVTAGAADTVGAWRATTSAIGMQDYPISGSQATDVALTMNFGDMSQYGNDFSVNTLTQDGYPSGEFSDMSIDPDGSIYARFTNGQSQLIGQIVLATFPSPANLRPGGATSWSESFASGSAVLSTPGSSGAGTIEAGALEQSNVNLTEQLVKMITAQRNFQANAQMIRTSDQVTQTIIQMR